jgi:hypothetical protein
MRVPRFLCAGLLGLAALLLVSCGGSGKGLIPTQNAGPLQSDFEAVAQAAQSGNGSCTATATAIRRTQQDFAALPATVDHGLRQTLETGISNLRSRALTVCAQPIPPTTEATATASSSSSTESSSTSSSDTQTVETTTTQSTPSNTATTTTPPGPGGGTQAPGTGGATPGEGGSTPGTSTPGEGTAGTGGGGTGGAGQGGGQ